MSKYAVPFLAISAAVFFLIANSPMASAQNSDSVSVNLGVLDDLDPMRTMPRLLMPSAQPSRGRIVLTPPAGVEAITPQRQRVTLRPPPGAPARVATAPKIEVPPPAPAAPAPPVSVTAPPAPAPATEPVASAEAEPVEPAKDDTMASTDVSGPATVSEPLPVNDSEPESEPSPVETEQTASLPPADTDAEQISIAFGPEETELPPSAATELSALVEQLKSNTDLRVQLLAYASSTDGSPSSVRRKSLSRALSVREFLMDEGVQSTRIEVRALGDQNEGGSPDRVDAVVEQR